MTVTFAEHPAAQRRDKVTVISFYIVLDTNLGERLVVLLGQDANGPELLPTLPGHRPSDRLRLTPK